MPHLHISLKSIWAITRKSAHMNGGPWDYSKSHLGNGATSPIWWFLYRGNLTHSFSCFLESPCPSPYFQERSPLDWPCWPFARSPGAGGKGIHWFYWQRLHHHMWWNPVESHFFPSNSQGILDKGWGSKGQSLWQWRIPTIKVCSLSIFLQTPGW